MWLLVDALWEDICVRSCEIGRGKMSGDAGVLGRGLGWVSAISPETSNDILRIQVHILQYIFSHTVLAYHPTYPLEILSAFNLRNFELFHLTEALH